MNFAAILFNGSSFAYGLILRKCSHLLKIYAVRYSIIDTAGIHSIAPITPQSQALQCHGHHQAGLWICIDFLCGVLGVFQHLVFSTVFFISWISLQKWNLFQNHDHKSFIVSYQFIILSVPCYFCFFFSNTKFRLNPNKRGIPAATK